MEKIPEKKELNVNVPAPYIEEIYKILLIANNRITWHPDELIPVGVIIKELKTIIEKINSLDEVPEEEQDEEPEEETIEKSNDA